MLIVSSGLLLIFLVARVVEPPEDSRLSFVLNGVGSVDF